MANLGSFEYVFKIQDDGSPVIQKVSQNMKSAMAQMTASTAHATAGTSSHWNQLKTSMTSGATGMLGSFTRLAATFISLYGAMRLFRAGWGFVKDSIQSAREDEVVMAKLRQALSNYGYDVEKVTKDLKSYVTVLEMTSGLHNDQAQEIMATLATFGAAPEVIKQATAATADLMAAKGLEASKAAMLMGKALVGNVTMLQRYGIIVDQAKYKTEGFSAVLEAMAGIHNEATAKAQTYEGQLIRLSSTYDTLQETVGYAIINNQLFRGYLETTIQTIGGMTLGIENNEAVMSAWVTRGIITAVRWIDILTRTVSLFSAALSFIMTGIYSFIQGLVKIAQIGAQVNYQIASILRQGNVASSFSSQYDSLGGVVDALGMSADASAQSSREAFKVFTEGNATLNTLKKEAEDAAKSMTNLGRAYKAGGGAVPSMKAAGGGGGAKKEKKDKWQPPTEPGEFWDTYAQMQREASQSDDWKKQEESSKRFQQMQKKASQMEKDPSWFWSEYAAQQRQYTSPQSTFKEQDEAFQRLKTMYAQVQRMATSFGQEAKAGWDAFTAGIVDANSQFNTFTQSMSELGQTTWKELGSAFTNSFTALMKGDFKGVGRAWLDFLKNILNAFISTIAQMIAQWLMMKLLTGLGFGGLASGGILKGVTGAKALAAGGVATAPSLALIGEGSMNEAVVPLPDGRSIPVSMKNRKDQTVEITIINTTDPVNVLQQGASRAPHLIINPVIADYQNRGSIQKIVQRGGR